MSVTQDYKLANENGAAVTVDFIADSVKESVKHLEGLITPRGANDLVSKIDKLIGEHLNHIFIADQIGQAIANAPAKNEKALQNLIAFRAHIASKKAESLSVVSSWKEYARKYEDKAPALKAGKQ